MHRTLASAAIKDDLLFITDQSGFVHCLDARTGKAHWTHDLEAATWSTPLIVGGRVYIGDQEGKVAVFKLEKTKELVSDENLTVDDAIYTTPVVANGVLFIATWPTLYAIAEGALTKPAAKADRAASE